ncbi:MAG: MopE-related protein [Myxococcales bacterium]|nr:MopE-related protein [Myxococcales bacterium]
MPRARLTLLFNSLLFIAGCGSRPQVGSAVFVKIERGTAASTCVRVTVAGDNGERVAGAKPFDASGGVAVGILQQDEGPEVVVTAVGGQGADCTPTQPAELVSGRFRFPETGTTNHTLRLERAMSSDGGSGDAGAASDAGTMDAGVPDAGELDAGGVTDAGDLDAGSATDAGPIDAGTTDAGPTDAGSPDAGPTDAGSPDAGPTDAGRLDAGPIDADNDGSPVGVDCDDANPQRFPNNPERCAGGVDEDCDDDVDCADPQCAMAACGLGVDGGSACVGTTCVELNCANGADDDLDTFTNCLDPDCASRPCAMLGTCQTNLCVQPMETVCNDGLDNDGDTFVDCGDGDCNARACTDGLSCTAGEVCSGSVCGGATTLTCTTPPTCFLPTGACTEPDAGCAYTPNPGTSCSDGLRCTRADLCLGDGGCAGQAVTCAQSTDVCRVPVGSCVEADGGCFFADLPNGTACDDGNACTRSDSCQSGSCQPGALVACAPTACRTVGPTCLSDGGCDLINLAPATPCDGGVCNGAGGCGRFPYVPSNFRDVDVPRDAGPALTITCPTTMAINPDSGITMTTACGVPVPSARVIAQAGGRDALLLTTPSLFIGDAGSLTITGSTFPVIFAVTGSIDIAGALTVSGQTGVSGPGGNDATLCGTSRGEPGQTIGTSPRGGGAGGSFGSTGSNGGRGDQAVALGGVAGPLSGGPTLVPLRGGCSGGNGGGTTGGGASGSAGGALQLAAGGTLRIRGRVTSAGKGGGPANANLEAAEGPGGGGAGSGGAILLEGLLVDITGHVTANGGGGGAGEAGSGVSNPGVDGLPFSANTAAGGIAPGGGGGSGGRGAARNGVAQAGVNGGPTNGGGGGGGGGFGRVRVNSLQPCTGAPLTMSPQASSASASCQY